MKSSLSDDTHHHHKHHHHKQRPDREESSHYQHLLRTKTQGRNPVGFSANFPTLSDTNASQEVSLVHSHPDSLSSDRPSKRKSKMEIPHLKDLRQSVVEPKEEEDPPLQTPDGLIHDIFPNAKHVAHSDRFNSNSIAPLEGKVFSPMFPQYFPFLSLHSPSPVALPTAIHSPTGPITAPTTATNIASSVPPTGHSHQFHFPFSHRYPNNEPSPAPNSSTHEPSPHEPSPLSQTLLHNHPCDPNLHKPHVFGEGSKIPDVFHSFGAVRSPQHVEVPTPISAPTSIDHEQVSPPSHHTHTKVTSGGGDRQKGKKENEKKKEHPTERERQADHEPEDSPLERRVRNKIARERALKGELLLLRSNERHYCSTLADSLKVLVRFLSVYLISSWRFFFSPVSSLYSTGKKSYR
jgi:hypothetical protein